MSMPAQFICDLMNYFSNTYSYELLGCNFHTEGSIVFEHLIPPSNDICAKYLSSAAVKGIFSLWQSGELDKDRNKPLWQIEFENCLEGS